jgi:hypothetical protein
LAICRKEQVNFISTGSVSPRRLKPVTEDDESTPWKHQYFQPHRPPPTVPQLTPKKATALPPIGLPKLRALFDVIGKTESLPQDCLGLALLALVAGERDKTVAWRQETALERNIRMRVEALDEAQRSRTDHARQLMLEQIPPKSEREAFLEEYKASKLHYMHASDSDAARVAACERQAAEEERQRQRRENEMRQAGEQRKQQQREAMEQRRKARELQLERLLEEEEDVRDTLDAVKKIRMRLEEETASGGPRRLAEES